LGTVVGLVVATLAGLLSLATGSTAVAIAQGQVVGLAYLVAGGIAWRRRPENATGPLLVAIGCSWYIVDFQVAPLPVIAGLAFATRRLVNVLSAYLLLAYPSGRLGPRRHHLAMGFAIAVTAIQMARLLLTERIPRSCPISTAGRRSLRLFNPSRSCPRRGGEHRALDRIPAVATALDHHGTGHRALLTAATAPCAASLARARGDRGLMRLAPLLSYTLTRETARVGGLSWVLSLARAAVPIGFLVGLLRMKMGKAAVAGLVVGLHRERTPASLERAIAHALHDPAVKLGYWSPAAGVYVDGTGKVLPLPRPGSGLSVTYVERADEHRGAIVHDAALDDDKALLDAVSAAFALAVDRDRLASTVHAQASSARQLPDGPVTFLYADVEGSTELLGLLGERYADVLAEERRLLRTIIRQHGGFEIDSRADEFFAAFPEDTDPAGAAIGIHRRLRNHPWPDAAALRVRIGLHSGQPQMTDEGYVGLDAHRACRVGSAGHGGQTLMSESARLASRLPPEATVEPLGAFRLKGLPGRRPSQLTVPDLGHVPGAPLPSLPRPAREDVSAKRPGPSRESNPGVEVGSPARLAPRSRPSCSCLHQSAMDAGPRLRQLARCSGRRREAGIPYEWH
jgi:class 3 adenylate cyclase